MEDEIIFREEDHKYFLNGEEIPSVSELTRFLSREIYGEADPIALQRAAEKGTAVHDALQTLDEDGEVEVPDEYAGYVQAYMNFHHEHDVRWEMIEQIVHTDKFAGRLDRYGYVDGKPCIVDFKTTSRITKAHEVLYSVAQTLYWMAIHEERLVDILYILQLKNDGTYKLIPLRIDPALASSCIIMHNAIANAKKRKKKRT